MTDDIDDGGPAFPRTVQRWNDSLENVDGMSLRQYAAIKLCVPDSGTPWLDDMIRQAQRDRIAGQAMAGMTAHPQSANGVATVKDLADMAYALSDALIAARKGE